MGLILASKLFIFFFFSFNRGRVQGARGFGLDFLVYITLSMSHNNMNHSIYPKTKS